MTPLTEFTLAAVIESISHHTSRTVTADSRLVEDLGLDSLEIINLTLALEVEFELPSVDYDQSKMQTVADIAAVIQSLMDTERSRPETGQ